MISALKATDVEHFLEPFWKIDDTLTAAERAEAYGLDVSLISENLRLTQEERLDRNQAALEFANAHRDK